MQVSGVNKVCWSVLNGDLLLLLCSWLLDRLNDQLVDSFVRGVVGRFWAEETSERELDEEGRSSAGTAMAAAVWSLELG